MIYCVICMVFEGDLEFWILDGICFDGICSVFVLGYDGECNVIVFCKGLDWEGSIGMGFIMGICEGFCGGQVLGCYCDFFCI